jgi:hypothetical protein
MKSVTISAKIPPALKRKLERHRIRVSEVVRVALEQEVSRAEERTLGSRLEEVSSQLSRKLRPEDIVLAVRASRRER